MKWYSRVVYAIVVIASVYAICSIADASLKYQDVVCQEGC